MSSDLIVAIHDTHRKMAQITMMSTDKCGAVIIGIPELRLLIPLLRQNLELVRKFDELRNLGLIAYESGDHEWVQDIEKQIAELSLTCNKPII